MWYEESLFYQIYPLGFTGSPEQNDGNLVNRIKKVSEWTDHFKKLNVDAVLFNPVFKSEKHGYDTTDYKVIDERLGSNDDFREVIDNLHSNDIRVVLDGVFNHVGREFLAFKEVVENRENSRYQHWFKIDFSGNTPFNDGFHYQPWEGHYSLVELNLNDDEVINYLFECVKFWIDEFDIDGLRLDVAYCLDDNFMRRLRSFVTEIKPDFYLMGEVVHGDYNRFMNDSMLHSVTNYQAYKGLWSSFNSMNMFEIEYTFNDHYINKYPGKKLFNFVDNHDVSRLASIISNEKHVPLVYGMLFAMVGTPSIYYGSEWGAKGHKNDGDQSLRVSYDSYIQNDLFDYICKVSEAYHSSEALKYGSYRKIFLTNKQLVFERKTDNETILVAINCEENDFYANFNYDNVNLSDLLSGEGIHFENGINLKGYSVAYYKVVEDLIVKEVNLLDDARSRINKIDKQMAELFEDRMKAVEDIIAYKLENQLDILDQGREDEVVENNLKNIRNEIYKEYYREYIISNMEISKKYQKYLSEKQEEDK